jgi:hypothetical protein
MYRLPRFKVPDFNVDVMIHQKLGYFNIAVCCGHMELKQKHKADKIILCNYCLETISTMQIISKELCIETLALKGKPQSNGK